MVQHQLDYGSLQA